MEAIRPTVFVESNAKGIERVKKGNYAFLMESISIEYEVQRNCDLVQIGGLLDQKGYGIATPPDSPYRGLLSEAILNLQESGKLQELKTKWWVDRIIAQGITCPPDKKDSSMELDIGNVGGVFVVLLLGAGVGVVIVIIEFIWKTKKVARHERVLLFILYSRTTTTSSSITLYFFLYYLLVSLISLRFSSCLVLISGDFFLNEKVLSTKEAP